VISGKKCSYFVDPSYLILGPTKGNDTQRTGRICSVTIFFFGSVCCGTALFNRYIMTGPSWLRIGTGEFDNELPGSKKIS
jgi:hypothetical protein